MFRTRDRTKMTKFLQSMKQVAMFETCQTCNDEAYLVGCVCGERRKVFFVLFLPCPPPRVFLGGGGAAGGRWGGGGIDDVPV